jgi:hypothetical protein
VCAGIECPLTGDACGDCLAQNCCGDFNACLSSPGCNDDVQCLIGCVTGGGSPATCGLQCVSSPQAFNVILCLGTECGAGACF